MTVKLGLRIGLTVLVLALGLVSPEIAQHCNGAALLKAITP